MQPDSVGGPLCGVSGPQHRAAGLGAGHGPVLCSFIFDVLCSNYILLGRLVREDANQVKERQQTDTIQAGNIVRVLSR